MSRPPEEEATPRLKVTEPKESAAGLPAVKKALEYSLQQTSPKRTALTLLNMNQVDGIDCPGCAWPDPKPGQRHKNEYCENGAKHITDEATSRRVTREFFATHAVSDLAQRSDEWLNAQGRLTEPMVKPAGADHYEPISWDDAFGLIATELNALDSPDEAAFYTSGRISNEAAFLLQLFVRAYGTNNLPDCSNLCHESSGTALNETIGVTKGTVGLEDFAKSDLIFVVGQNPGTNHPRQLTALEEAKANGARVIAINPLPEAGLKRFKNPQKARGVIGRGVTIADELLQIRIGGDLMFFRALNRLLLEAEDAAPGTVLDGDFIAADTTGFAEFSDHVRATDWEEVFAATGLTREQIEGVREEVLGADRIIVCWAMGLTQHPHAVPTIREIVNFLLLRGNLGRPGTGACPVRGHSNVQGDRTMGIWERSPDSFLDALQAEFGFDPPREHGYDAVRAIRAMAEGRVKVFLGMAGNFVRATPDSDVTEAGMRQCRLTAHVSTKLNRSHTTCGEIALILPAMGRTERDLQASGEQFVTVEDSMSEVHLSKGRLEPASPDLLSEVAILCRLATATLGDRVDVPWSDFEGNYDLIRDRISRVVPGFDDFNARVTQPGGLPLVNPVNIGEFRTSVGKAIFSCNSGAIPDVPEGHLVLQTIRSHDQWNTVPYSSNDRYRGIHGDRRVVLVNAEDLAARGLTQGDKVDLVSVWSDRERRADAFTVVPYPTPRGCAAAYFPETNVLVPLDSVASGSNQPAFKSVIIRLERTTTA